MTEPFRWSSFLHPALGLSAVVAWPAAFALNPLNRAVASLVALVLGVLVIAAEGPVAVAALLGAAALSFFAGSVERTSRR